MIQHPPGCFPARAGGCWSAAGPGGRLAGAAAGGGRCRQPRQDGGQAGCWLSPRLGGYEHPARLPYPCQTGHRGPRGLSGRFWGAPAATAQQEPTPNILDAVGEASPGATVGARPKHKPRGPRRRFTGSRPALRAPGCSGVCGSTLQVSRPVGSSIPSLGRTKSPQGHSTQGRFSCWRGEQQHPAATRVPSPALQQRITLCSCPLRVGATVQGQRANLCLGEEGMGVAEGAAPAAIAHGAMFQRALGTVPSGEAAGERAGWRGLGEQRGGSRAQGGGEPGPLTRQCLFCFHLPLHT